MPSELDPLLPQTKPAPEISTYGFWERPSDEDEEDTPPSLNTRSSLSRIIALFAIVVTFSLFIAFVLSNTSSSKDRDRQEDNATIAARVDKILSHTPLIGQYLASLLYAIVCSVDGRNFLTRRWLLDRWPQ